MIDDIVVRLVFLEMNSLHISIFRPSEVHLDAGVFLPLLVLLSLGLAFASLGDGFLLALILAFLRPFLRLLIDIFSPDDAVWIWYFHKVDVVAVNEMRCFPVRVEFEHRLFPVVHILND